MSRARPTSPAVLAAAAPGGCAACSRPCCCRPGVRMFAAGDELGRTQGGNNNAYCLDFAGVLARLRDLADWRSTTWWPGPGGCSSCAAITRSSGGAGSSAATGMPPARKPATSIEPTPTGEEMTQDDWGASDAKSLGVFLNGEAISEPDPHGERSPTPSSCCCSTRTASLGRSPCPRRGSRRGGRSWSTRPSRACRSPRRHWCRPWRRRPARGIGLRGGRAAVGGLT